jgi:hypothetical protein
VSYRDGLTALRGRRAQGCPLDRAEIDRRFVELRGGSFEDPDMLLAFADVFNAVCAPPHVIFAPRREKCSVDFDRREIRFGGDLKSAAGDRIGTIDRQLDFDVDVAFHNQIIIAPAFRSVALGAIILRHSLGFYEQVALSEVHLTAGLTTGPYLWAKLGFDFADPRDRAQMQNWFARVNAKLDLGLDCRQPRSAREWASLGTDPRVECSLDAIAAAFANERDKIHERAQDNEIELDAPLTAGKAILLSGPKWHGRLPVSRAAQTLLQVYIGARGARAELRLQTSAKANDKQTGTP